MELLNRAQTLLPWMTEVRRTLHRHPEPGNKELFTAEYVESVLRELGLSPRRLLDTAVIADLHGGAPGPTVALRADMDALPVTEDSGVEYASLTPGMMHACGHDLHMTAVLGAARLLTELPFAGTVRLLFQPDEELNGGAQRMIDAGTLDGVSMVFGCHVRPDLPAGQIGTREGPFYAASNPFSIILHGKSAHGAEPQKGADAVMAGARIVTALQERLARHHTPAVLTVGSFHGGRQCNLVADHAVLEGILRTFGKEDRLLLTEELQRIARETADPLGVTAEVRITWGYSGITNPAEGVRVFRQAAESLLGQDVCRTQDPVMITEDFGAFLEQVPGCFWHLGTGGDAPLHNGSFCPPEECLPLAAALHAQTCLTALAAQQ